MRGWIWIGLIFFNLAPVKAEHLETRRNVGIKSAPSKEADLIYSAAKGEKFPLQFDGQQINGYYGILLPGGVTGYVFITMVIIHKGDLSVSLPSPPDVVSYYADTIHHLTWEQLKFALHKTIRNHRVFKNEETWEILCKIDEDPKLPGQVLLIYTHRSQPAAHWDRGTKYDYEQNGYS